MSQNLMSVSSLNTKIGSLLEATFMHVMVEGEIASVTYHRSGHVYFSIKDNKSTLRCVMWRSNAARMRFKLEQGEHIVVEGSIGVYVPRGEYQFIATHVEPYGKGTLAVAFEQLKTELQAKGYFDPALKKPLSPFPRKIALVTAAGGAALQDMLKVAQTRWPLVEITVIDVLVQGDTAAPQIAQAITHADTLGVDIIVTGRGGGSTEDLCAFN
jgi:exodeoxyribonuclease VII large subunit